MLRCIPSSPQGPDIDNPDSFLNPLGAEVSEIYFPSLSHLNCCRAEAIGQGTTPQAPKSVPEEIAMARMLSSFVVLAISLAG